MRPFWILAVLLCLGVSPVSGIPEANYTITAGYRADWITALIYGYNPSGRLISINDLKIDDIRLYEFGIEGVHTLAKQLVFLGHAKVGTVVQGRYLEEAITFYSLPSVANARGGWSTDVSLGLGYQLPLGFGITLQPNAGWSYNRLSVKMGHATTAGMPDPALDGLTYRNIWQGPWIGLGSSCDWHPCKITSGYEYHYPNWKADWLISKDTSGGPFSDVRRSHHASGHVLFINGAYTTQSCWSIGCGFRCGYFVARKGIEEPRAGSFDSVGVNNSPLEVVHDATWVTLQARLLLGYEF